MNGLLIMLSPFGQCKKFKYANFILLSVLLVLNNTEEKQEQRKEICDPYSQFRLEIRQINR
jgi:hypothetical protein